MRPALARAASIALFAFTFMTMWTTGQGRLAVDIHIATELISAAAALAVRTAWSAAHLIPTLALAGNTAETRTAALLVRRAFSVAAGFGVTVALIYGLAVGVLLGATTTEYLSAAWPPCRSPPSIAHRRSRTGHPANRGHGLARRSTTGDPTDPPRLAGRLRPCTTPSHSPATSSPAAPTSSSASMQLSPGSPSLTITRSPVVRLAGAEILGIGGLAVASLHKAVRERHLVLRRWSTNRPFSHRPRGRCSPRRGI